MSHSNAATVLSQFGHKIGQPQIAFTDDRVCTLSFDNIVTHLELAEDGSVLSCYFWIADIDEARRAEVAIAIADANYLLARTHGATLGMNPLTGDLVLSAKIPDAILTLASFEQTLENLLELTQFWQEKIVSGLSPEATEAAPVQAHHLGVDSFSFRA